MNTLTGAFGMPDFMLPVLLVIGFGCIIAGVVLKIMKHRKDKREEAEYEAEQQAEDASYGEATSDSQYVQQDTTDDEETPIVR